MKTHRDKLEMQLLRYHLDNVGAGGVDAGDDVHADVFIQLEIKFRQILHIKT